MKLNWKYTLGWIVWIIGFGLLEYRAIKNKKPGDTLSAHVWSVIGTGSDSPSVLNWITRGVLAVGFGWLIPHFYLGWW